MAWTHTYPYFGHCSQRLASFFILRTMETIITPVSSEVPRISELRFTDLINAFINDQDVRQSSKSNYQRILKQYFSWVNNSNLRFSDLTRVDVLRYKDELLSAGMSSLSVGTYLSTVRRFYEFCEGNRYYPNIAKGVRSPRRKMQFKKESLNQDQSRALLNFYKDDIRNYAIISLLLGAGLRTIELIRANVDDLSIKDGKQILFVHGKGQDSANDFVKLPAHTYAAIMKHLSTRKKIKSGEPLFVSRSNNSFNERLTTRSISKIAKEGLKAIGLDSRNLTAHSLRHTTAITIIKAGLGIEFAQHVLRHASIATTQIYTASIKDEMRLQDNTEMILNNLMG